jgi:hypothetical protein
MENVKKMIDSLSSKISYIFHFLKKRVHIKINVNSVLEHIIVLELYTLLTILAFHKLFILGIDKVLIGDGGDAYQHIWNFWWVKKAILEGRNIFYTDYLFYPNGVHLYFHTLNLPYSILSIPLSYFLELHQIYNVFILIAFILAGFFEYLFIRKLTNNLLISFLGGFTYMFSPFNTSRSLGQLDLLSSFIIPLFFLFLFKNSKNQKFILTSLLFLSYFLHPYYFLILSISLISSIFIDVVIERKIATDKFLALLLGIILLIPIIDWYVKYFPKREERPVSGTLFINFSSLTVNHFSILSLVPIFAREDKNVNTFLQPLTIVLFLPILFCYLWWLQPKSIRNKNVYTFLLLILVSTFLILMKWENIKVKLGAFSIMSTSPSLFLSYMFPFKMSHYSPSYFSVLLSFSIVSLFSILLNEIRGGVWGFPATSILSLLLLILGIIELFPLRDFPYIVSINYQEINRIRDVNGTILNVPIGYSKAMYLQTIHNRKIVDGYISRIPLNDLYEITSFFSILNTSDCENFIQILTNNEINYVITYNEGWVFQNDLRDLNYFPFFQTVECLEKENNRKKINKYQITNSITLYSLS